MEFTPQLGRGSKGSGPGGHKGVSHFSKLTDEPKGHFEEQSLADLELEGASVTWNLIGCIRPRPNDVKILRSPFSGMVAQVFVWPGDLVSEDDLLVAFIIPEQFDWIETILSSQIELKRLDRLEELLINEGQAKAVKLIGEILVATAKMKRVQGDLELLEGSGTGEDAKGEIAEGKVEVEEARAEVIALRGLAQTYAIDLGSIPSGDIEDEIGDLFKGAMPTEIRSQIEMIQFSRDKAKIASDIAGAKLKILGTKGEQIEGLQGQVQDPLKSAFIARAAGAGIVTDVFVSPPIPITPEDKIMRMVDYRKVHVEIGIPQSDIARVLTRVDETLYVRVDGIENKTFRGKFAYVDTEIDANDGNAHLVVEVENTKGMILRDGMSVVAGFASKE
ncbi:MAG: efflux RND transporter periplasmic adaptor subunit [Candidatus Omnitrophica bacterium]|nr:efflux RND transporter periplasmic adaptor subunit [Candidatus Omnitrophota bacterium]